MAASEEPTDQPRATSPGDAGKAWRNNILATMSPEQKAAIFSSLSPTAQAAMLTAMSEATDSSPQCSDTSNKVSPPQLNSLGADLPLEDEHGVSTGVPLGDTVSKLPWLCGTPGCTKPDKHSGCCDSEIRQGPRKRKRPEEIQLEQAEQVASPRAEKSTAPAVKSPILPILIEKRTAKMNPVKQCLRDDDKELCGVISTRGVACKQTKKACPYHQKHNLGRTRAPNNHSYSFSYQGELEVGDAGSFNEGLDRVGAGEEVEEEKTGFAGLKLLGNFSY